MVMATPVLATMGHAGAWSCTPSNCSEHSAPLCLKMMRLTLPSMATVAPDEGCEVVWAEQSYVSNAMLLIHELTARRETSSNQHAGESTTERRGGRWAGCAFCFARSLSPSLNVAVRVGREAGDG